MFAGVADESRNRWKYFHVQVDPMHSAVKCLLLGDVAGEVTPLAVRLRSWRFSIAEQRQTQGLATC